MFSVSKVETVVTSTSLGGVSGQAAPKDQTLAAIATSLRISQPEQSTVPAETERECTVVEQPESGPARVDLAADACAVVPEGGMVSVTLGAATRSLELPTGRDWLLVAASAVENAPAVAIVDLTTGGYLIIKAEDGSELSRSLGDGGAALGILFDALAPATPASGEN